MRILGWIMSLIICTQLAACMTVSEIKAPCDYEGHFCGSKIKINQ